MLHRLLLLPIIFSMLCYKAYAQNPGLVFSLYYDVHELYSLDKNESCLMTRNFYNTSESELQFNEESTYYGFETGLEFSIGFKLPNSLVLTVPIGFRNAVDDYQSLYTLNKTSDRKDFTVYSSYVNTGFRLIYPIILGEAKDLKVKLNTLMGIDPKMIISREWQLRSVGVNPEEFRNSTSIEGFEKRWYFDVVMGAGFEFQYNKMSYGVRTLLRTNNREGLTNSDDHALTRTVSYQIGFGLGVNIDYF